MQLNTPLPGYPGGANGLVLALSQTPCMGATNQACCSAGGVCANWAGAHLVSAGCILFGVLELEAAFQMPASGGAFYFTALCASRLRARAAWDETEARRLVSG